MAIQKIVNHPLTRRMNFGSPWTAAHNDFAVCTTTPSTPVVTLDGARAWQVYLQVIWEDPVRML
jgi:hypothetical protein